MSSSLDPMSGSAGIVDKMIGNAFEIVRMVARELDAIKYVAAHMGSISSVAKTMQATMPERSAVVVGSTGALGSMVELDLPAGASVSNIRGFDVLLITPAGDVYGATSNVFTAGIIDGYLSLTTNLDAPIVLVNAEIRWRVTYDSTVS